MNKITLALICFAFACTANAGTIFSCDLSNKHNVTIDSSNQEGTAYYYGSVGSDKSDLVLDSKTASFGNYMGPSWEYKYFRFAKGDYSYVVYNYDDKTKGLAVYKNKKLLMNKKCASNVEYDENGYLAASNQIKHDSEDDAFGFMPDDTSSSTDDSRESQQQESQQSSEQLILKAPECSGTDTLSVLNQIITQHYDPKTWLVENIAGIRTTEKNTDINMVTCEANVIIQYRPTQRDINKAIKYSAQRTDDGKNIYMKVWGLELNLE